MDNGSLRLVTIQAAFPHFPYYPSALPDAGTLLRVVDFMSILAPYIYHLGQNINMRE